MITSVLSIRLSLRTCLIFVARILAPIVFLVSTISCDKGSDGTEPKLPTPPVSSPGLVETLESEYNPLPTNPLNWSNTDLAILDGLAEKQVIALGEGTHGTAEFFNSKFRIFKYLVENHGFRVFAIEADFGESLMINDAIQRGAMNEIVDLMKTKMIFWTWKTEEVQAFLEWMSNYNVGKSEDAKLQYYGIDAQINFHNPGLLQSYLQQTNAPFLSYANAVLQEAKSASDTNFGSYGEPEFAAYMEKLDDLRDSIQSNEPVLIDASSESAFKLNLHLAEVIKQVSQVQFAIANNDFSINHRDKFMADNALWVRGYFNNVPVVLWAHNIHVSKDPIYGGAGGAMGRQLQQQIGAGYSNMAFLFAQGTFTAVTQQGDQYLGIQKQSIEVSPKANSLNSIFSMAAANVFNIDLPRLNPYEAWQNAYANSLQFFHLGAVYNNNPTDQYMTFNPVYYDRVIFFDRSTASVLLNSN